MDAAAQNRDLANESFATTNWSVVLTAGKRDCPEAEEALSALCHTYWYPLFSFARRQGHPAAHAEDLTQGFFEMLLQKEFLKAVDQDHGRFRAFLLGAFKHFIANQQRAARTRKRGGNHGFLSIDFSQADLRYTSEPSHQDTPERLFEHQWALALLDNVIAELTERAPRGG